MKFSGVTIIQGVEFSIFPIDIEWALQQCSAIALPVILQSPPLSSLSQQQNNAKLLSSTKTKLEKKKNL